MTDLVRGSELDPLIDVERTEEPVLCFDVAKREAIAGCNGRSDFLARTIQIVPRGDGVNSAGGHHRLSCLAPGRAVPHLLHDIVRQRLACAPLGPEPRGARLRESAGD